MRPSPDRYRANDELQQALLAGSILFTFGAALVEAQQYPSARGPVTTHLVSGMFDSLRKLPAYRSLTAIEVKAGKTVLLPDGSIVPYTASYTYDQILTAAEVTKLSLFYQKAEAERSAAAVKEAAINAQAKQTGEKIAKIMIGCGCLSFIGGSVACCSISALAAITSVLR
jgi:hypothetical protein